MKKIVLCADDFGQDAIVSKGIADLFGQGRLSATSCMTNTPYWPKAARLLKPFINQVDIGLHFNLTYGDAIGHVPGITHQGSLPKLGKLLLKAQCGWVSSESVLVELRRQLESFYDLLGRWPDFIDGHQHVHQFAGVREALIELCLTDLKDHPFYVRSVYPDIGDKNWKAKTIRYSGAKALDKQLKKHNIAHNTTFGGIYNFATDPKIYPAKMVSWLAAMDQNGIIMCHPAWPDGDHEDSIAPARAIEYQYLSSDTFGRVLTEQNITLGRFF